MKNYKLFTTKNTKVLKGEKLGYKTLILHLAPEKLAFQYALENSIAINPIGLKALQGRSNLCPYATKECKMLCLNKAGNGNYPNVQLGRINKTIRFLNDPELFVDQLKSELEWHLNRAEKDQFEVVVRLNGTQDLLWESIQGSNGQSIVDQFSAVQFYDYTKWPLAKRVQRPNYFLLYSYTGTAVSGRLAIEYLQAGHNVAFVYDGLMPETWNGFTVVDGDETDLRFLDPAGSAVALKAKGKAKGKAGKFKFVGSY